MRQLEAPSYRILLIPDGGAPYWSATLTDQDMMRQVKQLPRRIDFQVFQSEDGVTWHRVSKRQLRGIYYQVQQLEKEKGRDGLPRR